jgi:hypothetical protein
VEETVDKNFHEVGRAVTLAFGIVEQRFGNRGWEMLISRPSIELLWAKKTYLRRVMASARRRSCAWMAIRSAATHYGVCS